MNMVENLTPKLWLVAILLCNYVAGSAQDSSEKLGEAIDNLTLKWDNQAESLKTYNGLVRFCDDKNYRLEVIDLLNNIHHFDSVLYSRLVKAQRFSHDKEIQKTLDDIALFEEDYNMKDFIHFLHQECVDKNNLEKNSDDLKKDIGENSYDGQVYIIEVELNKFIKQITKRVDVIRKHVHHLHIE